MTIVPYDERLAELHRQECQLQEQLESEKRKAAQILAKRKTALERQLRRVRSVAASHARKQDTRWKILVGGTILASVKTDPAGADRLDRKMDESLTQPRDRVLLEKWRQERTP